jgi:hypothetical protein
MIVKQSLERVETSRQILEGLKYIKVLRIYFNIEERELVFLFFGTSCLLDSHSDIEATPPVLVQKRVLERFLGGNYMISVVEV